MKCYTASTLPKTSGVSVQDVKVVMWIMEMICNVMGECSMMREKWKFYSITMLTFCVIEILIYSLNCQKNLCHNISGIVILSSLLVL